MTGRPGFDALAPFFRIIDEGLSGLVDGEHFFDTLAEDAVFEYVISVPGYPRRIVGREAVAELYSGYGETMVLHGSDELAVHRDREASVVVLEYAVHGRAVSTGHAYDNHFVSVITIKDRGGRDRLLSGSQPLHRTSQVGPAVAVPLRTDGQVARRSRSG